MLGLGNAIHDWIKSLPIFTKYWFGGTVLFTLLGRFSILYPHWLILTWDTFISRFHIWRPVTGLLYYPINPWTGFHFLVMLYYLYNYSLRLETGLFDGRPADYMFMLIFNWLLVVVLALFLQFWHLASMTQFLLNMHLASLNIETFPEALMEPMVMSVIYVWCQINKDTIVNFWFGTQFKAMYLPWVLFGIALIIEFKGLGELCGILIGHIYFFLMFKYPQDFGGPSLLSTPNILYSCFPNKWGSGVVGYGQAPARAPQQGGGPWGGRGQRLGYRRH